MKSDKNRDGGEEEESIDYDTPELAALEAADAGASGVSELDRELDARGDQPDTGLPPDVKVDSFLQSVDKLRKDMKEAGVKLSPYQARFLVDIYYAMQKYRIQSEARARSSKKIGEPHAITDWACDQFRTLEDEVRKVLAVYAQSKEEGRWALSQHGIGPVLTAGLLAHIDIKKAPTVGHIWRFAGLDPTTKWKKGQKRPWNARLKVLCWKIGESFKKTSGSQKAFYGGIYRKRKELEVSRTESGAHAEQARVTLSEKKISDAKTRAAYDAGKLPAGRLDLRATRYATKIFLSHFHHVAHEVNFGTPPPKPFVVEHMGHVHVIQPPGWESKIDAAQHECSE